METLIIYCTISFMFIKTLEARPPFLEALNKVTEALDHTTYSLIKNFTPEELGNRTKTRILFKGDLFGSLADQDIIFPDTYSSLPSLNATPKCASKGKTFCEGLDDYPYQQVRGILQRKKVSSELFGKDEAYDDDRFAITNRNGDFESFVCGSIQKTIFPRIGKNKSNKWRYIINQDQEEKYIQGIRVEYCRKEGASCDLIGERANGYITSCKQKYMLRRMMSLTDEGDPIQDSFQLPSACCCSYRKDLSFLSRFGTEEISARTS